MKTLLPFALALLSVLEASSQNLSLSWVKQFGGPSNMTPLGMAKDPSGAIITSGFIEGVTDFDPGPESNPASTNGLKDAYISKLNSNGDYVWSVAFGGSGNDLAYDVATDVAGNVYCTGEFTGTVNFNPQGTAANLTAFFGYNAFIVKYSASGQFQWVKKFGGASSGYESGRNISIDGSGNIITTGQFYDLVDFDPNSGVATTGLVSSYSCYMSKLTSNGDYVWAKSIPGYYTTCSELNIDANNNIYWVGYFYGSTDFDPSAANYSLVGQYYDTYIAKYTPQGNFTWVKQLTSTNYCFTYALEFATDGSLFLAGGFNGSTDFDPDLVATQTVTNTSGSYHPFLLKLSNSGLFQFVKELAPSSVGSATGVKLDSDGNIYVGGHFKGTSDFNPDPVDEFPMTSSSTNYEDAFITKLNSAGDFISAYSFGGTSSDYVNGLQINPANGTLSVIGNFSGTCDFDPASDVMNLTSAGGSDGYIARFVQCSAVSATIQINACGSYDLNGTNYTESGTYSQTLESSLGCDSTLTLELTISGATFSNITLYTNDVITFNGQSYGEAGQYTQTISNQAGCDSIIYVEVVILENNFELEIDNGIITTPQFGNSYQWIDCNNNNLPITGETNSTFTPTQSGSYALIVYGNEGDVTSNCIDVIVTGNQDIYESAIQFFPNPLIDQLIIKSEKEVFNSYQIYDMQGKLVLAGNITQNIESISLRDLSSGIYSIQLIGQHMFTSKIVKQ